MSSPRGNVIWLALTRVVLVVAGAVVSILLARGLGDAAFGQFSFLQRVAMLMAFVGQMELQVLLAREVSREPEQAATWLGRGLTAIAFNALPTILLVTAYTWFFDGRPELVALAPLAALLTVTTGGWLVVQGVLQGLRRMSSFPLANLAGRGFVVVGLVVVLALGLGLASVFLVQTAAIVVTIGVLLVAAVRHVGPPRVEGLGRVLRLIRSAVPFALNRLFGGIYMTSDVLVVAYFHSDAEVGHYNIAAILLIQLSVVSGILVDSTYPALARAIGKAAEAGDTVSFALRLLLLAGAPIGVGAMCVAPDLVEFVLGDAYLPAIPAMLVLLPILPVRYTIHLAGSALSAFNRQPERTRASLYAAVLNVAANLAVVPFLGALGAAITTLVTEALLAAWLWWRVSPNLEGVRVIGPLLRILVAVAVMAAVVLPLSWVPLAVAVRLPLQILVGVVVYGGVSFGIGAWRVSDLRRLRSL